jgi:hypothetical protein
MISQGLQHRTDEEELSAANHAAQTTRPAEPQQHRGLWQRFTDAFYEARMRSAAHHIEQHRETMALWRRYLAQRKEHLHLIRRR